MAIKPLLGYLQQRDLCAARAVDAFIAISEASRQYIAQYYKRDATVLHCPIELSRFRAGGVKKDHFLIVSRLESWKKTEYAIEAFNRLGLPLRIVGAGPEEQRLREMAKKNITFLGAVDDESLAREYQEARAVVFTPFLEYGLIPLESNASGTPVICFGQGGVRETMIPINEERADPSPGTAVFFYEQTAGALISAVQLFEKCKFDPEDLANHASRWSPEAFQRELRKKVEAFSQ
jgi:glycosyltransferase involved in cell wall biosynthesis